MNKQTKKPHPKYPFLYSTLEGEIYHENRNVPTQKAGTRETFVVRNGKKFINFGVRRFIWECQTGKELEEGFVITSNTNSNHFNNLIKMSKSEHASKVYTEIWRKNRENGKTK